MADKFDWRVIKNENVATSATPGGFDWRAVKAENEVAAPPASVPMFDDFRSAAAETQDAFMDGPQSQVDLVNPANQDYVNIRMTITTKR